MELTAELSLYPLREDYEPPIRALIDDLAAEAGLTVVTNAMSTQLRGDFDTVMSTVAGALRASAERFGRQVLVCKFIPGALAIDAAP
ncbi:MAG: YkoF family thiamine/hydroxymethylpyrimidine-binding protein [Pseudohaliea sp.]